MLMCFRTLYMIHFYFYLLIYFTFPKVVALCCVFLRCFCQIEIVVALSKHSLTVWLWCSLDSFIAQCFCFVNTFSLWFCIWSKTWELGHTNSITITSPDVSKNKSIELCLPVSTSGYGYMHSNVALLGKDLMNMSSMLWSSLPLMLSDC